MLSVVYRVVTQIHKEEEFEEIARLCSKCAHEDKDCLYYSFYKSLTNPKEFIVYYKFTDKNAQDRHILNLHQKIGPPRKGRDLPERFLELLEDEELILFKNEDDDTTKFQTDQKSK